MNKLFGSKAYLIGCMDRVADQGAGWRDMITPKLHQLGVMVFNPLKKPLDEESAIEDDNNRMLRKQWKKDGMYNSFLSVRKIRNTDLRMVDVSDFIIANIDVEVHACGTYEELFWANRSKKPVLVHCEQGKENCPDWLFMTLPHQHIFSNWDGLIEYLEIINRVGKDDTGRWVLFDMREEIRAINDQN